MGRAILISALSNRWTDAALIVAGGAVSFAAIAHVALTPRDRTAPLAVVFSIGTSSARAMALSADAGARILRSGPSSNIVVVVPDDTEFSNRAYARGALLVADASTVEGCEDPAAK